MQLTQEYIEAWTDSVYNAWSAQPSPMGVTHMSDWACVLIVIAVLALIGIQSYFSYKEKMAELHNSDEYKRNKQAHEEAQKERSEPEEVSEG